MLATRLLNFELVMGSLDHLVAVLFFYFFFFGYAGCSDGAFVSGGSVEDVEDVRGFGALEALGFFVGEDGFSQPVGYLHQVFQSLHGDRRETVFPELWFFG